MPPKITQPINVFDRTNLASEVRALTGIRGVAAIYVMLFHYLQDFTGNDRIGVLIRHGYLSVDLFFILSGFVMAMNYGVTFSARFEFADYRLFLLKRFARVYPLFFLITTAIVAGVFVQHQAHPGWIILIANFTMMQGWGVSKSIVGPGWSVSTEVFAYIIFPALIALLVKAKARVSYPCALAAVGSVIVLGFVSTASLHADIRHGPLDVSAAGETFYPMLRCIAEFSLGLFAYRLRAQPLVTGLLNARWLATVLSAITLALLSVDNSDVVVVIAFVLLVVSLSAENSLASRFLGSPVIHWLGLISYSIYLVHGLIADNLRAGVVSAFRDHVPHANFVASILFALGTIVLSAATYYGIENPCRRLAGRLTQRSRPAVPLDAVMTQG